MESLASSSVNMESLNPCCVLWKTRYSKMVAKRNALRQGVEILKDQIDRLQKENAKVSDEERARLNNVKEEKVKEASLRFSINEENAGFKSEISPAKSEAVIRNLDLEKEATQLQACVSERDVEIHKLRQLLAEEVMKCDAEKKTAELERKKASELQKSLEHEKNKAGEACKMADAAARKAEDHKLQFETLKKEFEKTNLKLAEVNRKYEAEKQDTITEKQYSVETKVKDEECRANTLLKQLEEEKKKVERLQKEIQVIMLSKRSIDSSELDELKRKLEAEKKKAAREKKLVEEEKQRVTEQRRIAEENEKRVSEERCNANTLLKQLEEERQKVETLRKEIQGTMLSKRSIDFSELDEVKRKFEAEKKKVTREKTFVEEEKKRVIEQQRIAETNAKRVSEERCRADKLVMQLKEEKLKVEKLQRKMRDVTSQKFADPSKLEELKKILEKEKEKAALGQKSVEEEKARAMQQRTMAEANEKWFFEEKCRADNLSMLLEEEKQKVLKLRREMQKIMSCQKTVNSSRLDEVYGNLEAEKKKVARERKRADMEKSNSEEQGKIAKENEVRAIEEKQRSENLLHELENARKKLKDKEHELHEVKSCIDLVGTSAMSPAFVMNEQAARVDILQEQLKFEKKQVKHAKEVSKLEKSRNSILEQELQKVKNDFQFLLDHLSMISNIFGVKNGAIYLPQKLVPPQMHFRGDEELRMSGLTSRDASCLQKPNMQVVQADHRLQSASGMKNDLDPLQGGSHGDILPSSALNTNTTSFSDGDFVGSQERLDGPITMSAGLSVENNNRRVTVLRHCNEFKKRKIDKNTVSVGEDSPRSPLETSTDHAKKRRKILDELESLKCMNLEGKKIFQEAEKKLYTLHNSLLQPKMSEQIEKDNVPLTVTKSNLCDKIDCYSKKMMRLNEPEVVLQRVDECIQMEVSPSVMETRESSQPLQIIVRDQVKKNQDAVTCFEQMGNGDYMKLLDLDDAGAEECFRMAMENPLSPILSEFGLLESGQQVGSHMLNVPISGNIEAAHSDLSAQNKNQLQFVMFSDMEDIGSRTRIYCATRICVARCFSSLQTNWSVQDILEALLLEKNLRCREKTCVLFSLMLLHFSSLSSSKPAYFHFQEQMDSFSTHIQSVLFNFATRELCAKICDLHDLLTLSEDFIIKRKIFSNDVDSELLDGCSSIIEILHGGEKILVRSKMASPDLVLAGSIVLASFSNAIGKLGSVCEVSFRVLQTCKAEYSLALSILHTFAYICGEDYFTISNYSSVMKVVKSVVTFIEVSLAKNAIKDLQPGDTTQHRFTPCVRCSFLKGSVSLYDVSLELLEDLQRHSVPQNSAHLSNSKAPSYFLGDFMSSLDLIGSIEGWDWVYDKIIPKLLEMLESSHQDMAFSTVLVMLLASLARLGVEACGYNETGVECVKRHLLGLLSQTVASKCINLLLAIVNGLIGLDPKVREMFQKCFNVELPSKEGLSESSSDIVGKFLSSLNRDQLTSFVSLVNTKLPM